VTAFGNCRCKALEWVGSHLAVHDREDPQADAQQT
jgi:hypothetical protein